MKKHWNNIVFITLSFSVWRLVLWLIQIVSVQFPYRDSFTTSIPWGNFDGVHYVLIAKSGYESLQHAFFPLYPMLIGFISRVLSMDMVTVGIVLSHVSFFISLIFIFFIAQKEFSTGVARWTIVFLLCYPMSFYFASVYTESMYLLFASATFYAFSKNMYWRSAFLGTLSSATRLFGILIPISLLLEFVATRKISGKLLVICFIMTFGLIWYLGFLQIHTGDSFAFMHEQPVFGAGRSGSSIILLPQVLYRYARIIFTTTPYAMQYWVSVLEVLSFVFASVVLFFGYMKGIKNRYQYYSVAVLLLPTLSGTLSSMPRYIVSAFPVFIVLSFLLIKRPVVRYSVLTVFLVLLFVSASMFLRGWFIS
ncbi:hypothetical protein HY947_04005 [Candidatus Gottesmanbacteria bacterium]|nr:hypothetical protein [Candidatus Gottesmanbacteria bacterium]